MALLNGEHTYPRLQRLFREADERYNSGLFHFQKEKDRVEPPDDLTPGLDIDDAVLKKIIRRLYYPESPYEFSVLPADILGRFTNNFSAKSSGSQKAIAPKSKTNRKSRKRAASITRPRTSSITSSRIQSANCSKTKRRNMLPSFVFSIQRAAPVHF